MVNSVQKRSTKVLLKKVKRQILICLELLEEFGLYNVKL